MKIERKQIGHFELFYRPGTSDEDVIGHSFNDDIFFEGVPEYKLAKEDTIVDIGAHIGTFSLLAASRVPEGKVYSFEPSKETYEILVCNKEINSLNNLKVFKVAISDRVGSVELFHDLEHGNWGHSIAKAISSVSETVETDTLENFFQKSKIKFCNFMKFNCEGAEFAILLNTPKEVLQQVKCMLVLYHQDMTESYTVEELKKHLNSSGFHLHEREVTLDPPRGWIIAYRAGFIGKLFIDFRCFWKFSVQVDLIRFRNRMIMHLRKIFPKRIS
jgi:FkbM family methyltransferase